MSDNLTHLKCDVELNLTAPSLPTANKWAADALRRVADRVEKNELTDGFHPVHDGAGKQIGDVYLDYAGDA